MLRASVTAESAGIPTVSLCGSHFEAPARATARSLGLEGAPLALYPGHIPTDDDVTFEAKMKTSVLEQIIEGLTAVDVGPDSSVEADPAPRDIVLRGDYDAVQEHFHDEMWSDGLPVTPPTPDRVQAFLEFTDREPDEVLAVLLPEQREATVWNVAVNAVMAGCKPEYMPIVLAMAEAIADPEYRIEDHGSTPGWEPLTILSGPIAKELDFNSGIGVQRFGRRPNTSVARFLRLFTRNVSGLRIPPGETDRAGIGNPIHPVMAEDEETVRSIGWPTFGDDIGLEPGESAVTVQSVVATSNPLGPFHGPTDEVESYLDPLVETFGKGALGYWFHTAIMYKRWHPIVLLSPAGATLLARDGWSKDDVRDYLFERSRIPASFVERGMNFFKSDIQTAVNGEKWESTFTESDDPERLIPTFLQPEWTRIIVAGNPGMFWQRGYVNNHEQGAPVTRKVAPPT